MGDAISARPTELILGYTTPLSARPGGRVEVRVSSSTGRYDASLVRLLSAGPGDGVRHELVRDLGSRACRPQERAIRTAGSSVAVGPSEAFRELGSFTVSLWVWPSLLTADPPGPARHPDRGRDRGLGRDPRPRARRRPPGRNRRGDRDRPLGDAVARPRVVAPPRQPRRRLGAGADLAVRDHRRPAHRRGCGADGRPPRRRHDLDRRTHRRGSAGQRSGQRLLQRQARVPVVYGAVLDPDRADQARAGSRGRPGGARRLPARPGGGDRRGRASRSLPRPPSGRDAQPAHARRHRPGLARAQLHLRRGPRRVLGDPLSRRRPRGRRLGGRARARPRARARAGDLRSPPGQRRLRGPGAVLRHRPAASRPRTRSSCSPPSPTSPTPTSTRSSRTRRATRRSPESTRRTPRWAGATGSRSRRACSASTTCIATARR